MTDWMRRFETATRRSGKLSTDTPLELSEVIHPFDERNIHPRIGNVSLRLFDDGHYSAAVFEAFKLLESTVKGLSKIRGKNGHNLMMQVFNEENPKIKLTELKTDSEVDEQFGFRHIFAGAMSAIRNPRGHEVGNIDTPEQCLDYLGFASMLLRRLSDRV